MLEKLAPQPDEKKQKFREAFFSTQHVKYVEIPSTILDLIPKWCAKETYDFDPFSQ